MPYAHRLRLRCFLEGIEVPIIACTTSVTANAPAQFQVQIPATDKAFNFLPRTLIHVFMWDYWQGASDAFRTPTSSTGEQTQTFQNALEEAEQDNSDRENEDAPEAAAYRPHTPNSDQAAEETLAPLPDLLENNDHHWKLLIGGEVIGYNFSKSHANRSINLQCLDWSVYWDTCYQYKVNVANLTGDHMAAFVGAGTTFYDTFFSSTTSTIVEAVTRRSVTQPELTGLLSGVVRLLESVGGVYIGNESQSLNGANPRNIRHRFRGVNDFFSIAELRLKLIYMITAAENDKSSARHFADRAFAMWGRRHASRLGKISSFREILNVMMQYIFHSVFPVVGPRMQPADTRLRTSRRRVSSQWARSPEGTGYIRELNTLRRSAQFTSNRMQYTQTDYPIASIRAQLWNIFQRGQALSTRAAGYGFSEPAGYLQRSADKAQILRNIYEGETGSQRTIYRQNQPQIRADCQQMVDLIGYAITIFERAVTFDTQTDTRQVQVKRRLNQQIIRPDIFMVAPPRCNVIFPELASNIQFSRMYLREVTRMRLTVADEIFGPDVLLNQVYYAPDVEVMGALPPRQLRRGGMGESGRRLSRAAYSKRLMNHELYTGVVPVFERMNEVNIYGASTSNNRTRNRSQEVNFRGARIPHVTRAVNHQFFKHRWQPRTLSVSGKFNPYVVAGFPCLVLDRYMTRPQSEDAERRGIDYVEATGGEVVATTMVDESGNEVALESEIAEEQNTGWSILRDMVPTQFVGLVESAQHSVSHNAAQSSFQLSHARTHRENEELLGSNRQELTRRSLIRPDNRGSRRRRRRGPGRSQVAETDRTDDGRAIKRSTVASIDTPQVGMVGPFFGEIIEVTPSTETGSHPLFGTYFGDVARRRRRRFPVNTPLRAIDLGDEVVTQAGGPNVEVELTAYRITEAIDRWVGQEVNVPLEDFVRPPWMSDVWRNDRIGAVYHQFFGTGSITDAAVMEAGSALSRRASRSAVDEALEQSRLEERWENVNDPIRADGTSTQEAGLVLTVERAIDLLVRTYSALRHNNFDVHEFIRAYTWRDMATLSDILGSADLAFDSEGRVTQGEEGLHSRAFGHGELGNDLRNLLDDNVGQILGLSTEEDRSAILSRLDKRREKSERIMAYMEELDRDRGLLG
jgi:hypothetical protein